MWNCLVRASYVWPGVIMELVSHASVLLVSLYLHLVDADGHTELQVNSWSRYRVYRFACPLDRKIQFCWRSLCHDFLSEGFELVLFSFSQQRRPPKRVLRRRHPMIRSRKIRNRNPTRRKSMKPKPDAWLRRKLCPRSVNISIKLQLQNRVKGFLSLMKKQLIRFDSFVHLFRYVKCPVASVTRPICCSKGWLL